MSKFFNKKSHISILIPVINAVNNIEILQQNKDIDTIVVPIGGGGLITGIAVAAKSKKPGIRVIGVQTEACPAMIKSYEDNTFYEEYPGEESICDALVGGIGKLSYDLAKDYVDDFIAVSEESIAKAVSFMAKKGYRLLC
ncbi:pyridoxal-phosphate dependent enzyme (plasmid) [Pseudalkalibacillus hwajinpoensis]|uniref:pyridoxal-phosphate dependent enzyme n=1 Tax=Guptibacillus hwajinpoensis TaxID=208199 RepID=UPI00325ACE04